MLMFAALAPAVTSAAPAAGELQLRRDAGKERGQVLPGGHRRPGPERRESNPHPRSALAAHEEVTGETRWNQTRAGPIRIRQVAFRDSAAPTFHFRASLL